MKQTSYLKTVVNDLYRWFISIIIVPTYKHCNMKCVNYTGKSQPVINLEKYSLLDYPTWSPAIWF